jgi:hypothetical protein
VAFVPDNALKIVIPAPYNEERLRSGYNVIEQYRLAYYKEHWREPWYEDTKGWYHDPQWKYRLWSIQCAHDRNHQIWKVAHALTRWGYIAAATGPLSSFFMW